MTAYISISYSHRNSTDQVLQAIINTLDKCGIASFVFVDQYTFNGTQEREMMQQALTDIDRCDLLIAETSQKAIGIGVEAGYAKARNKPVIYVRQKDAEHSTTVSGISDLQVVYANITDLQNQLTGCLADIMHTQDLPK